jgi:ATP-independent RNA helicase DbpA
MNPRNILKPTQLNFNSLNLSKALTEVVQELGFTAMTPIQAQSIPSLLEGKDLIGQSKTGSGKTAAFSLPILNRLDLSQRHIQALILCPTRELCTQVAREIRRLGRKQPGLQILIISGGQPIYPQLTALEKGVHIVVGTPGRVLDHLRRKSIELGGAKTLVLDEADRMLDMGFQEDKEQILDAIPKSRQTVFFSATYPKTIDSMSRKYQKNPVRVTMEDTEAQPVNIRQMYYLAEPEVKLNGLVWLIQQNQPESAIIFCNLKATVIELGRAFSQLGISTGALHGDLEQAERDRVMAKFRNKSTRILVATDVAARGIDVENLDAVFNYDLPLQADIYVHRIGRTGRAGKKGLAISLVTARQKSKIPAIEAYTGIQIQEKTLAQVSQLNLSEFKSCINQTAAMATLYVGGGRKDKMRPGDLLGALTGEAGGFKGNDIGKIEIHDRFSYVAISKSLAPIALQRLRDGLIKGRKFRVEMVR